MKYTKTIEENGKYVWTHCEFTTTVARAKAIYKAMLMDAVLEEGEVHECDNGTRWVEYPVVFDNTVTVWDESATGLNMAKAELYDNVHGYSRHRSVYVTFDDSYAWVTCWTFQHH